MLDCKLPEPAPLVSLIILTCNRPKYLRLALNAASKQTYCSRSPCEAIIVDDGAPPVSRSLSADGISVRIVRVPRLSIGGKRNAGVRASRGAVILHFDDDDLHDPRQVETLACPILHGMSEMTSLTFSYIGLVSTRDAKFFEYRRANSSVKMGRSATGPFLGSLAYSRAVAQSLSASAKSSSHSRTGGLAPFACTSLSEDLHFVERALAACYRMLPISGIPLVYTRHA